MNLSCRHPRLFACLFALGLGVLALSSLSAAPAEKAEPNPTVTTTKRSAIKVGNSSFALVKGTKLEVIGREDKLLLVKYRTSQGKIPYADTDYVLSEDELAEEEAAAAEPPAAPAPVKPAPPLPAVSKNLPDDGQDKSRAGSNQQRGTAGQTPGGQQPTTVPPALSVDGIRPATAGTDPVPTAVGNRAPATNYGKAVQKARQVEQAHKEKLVNPTDEILAEPAKK